MLRYFTNMQYRDVMDLGVYRQPLPITLPRLSSYIPSWLGPDCPPVMVS